MKTNLLIILLLIGFAANGYSQLAYPIKQITKTVTSKIVKETSEQGVKSTAKQGAKSTAKNAVVNSGKALSTVGTANSLPTFKTLSAGAEELCIKYSSKFSNTVPEKVRNEINQYVDDVLVKERNFLRNKARGNKPLTDNENERLKVLNKMLPKEGRQLSNDARKDMIAQIDRSIQSITTEIPHNLSIDKYIHILLRHTSPQYKKSYFNLSSSDDLIKGIDDVITTGKKTQPDNMRCIYYLKTYDSPIGYDNKGNPINDWLVICKPNGEIINSYPPNKKHHIYELIYKNEASHQKYTN